MNSLQGFNGGAQNPQLCESPKHLQTDEEKREGRNCNEEDSNGAEETRVDELLSPTALHTPLLRRIDRLDILIDNLQDKRTMNANIPNSTLKFQENTSQEYCKPVSRVLEEIQAKGTILDRIATLEDRVTKLAEELERRKSAKQCMNVMEGVRLQLKGLTPPLPSESAEKGLHDHFSRRVLQAFHSPKDEDEVKKEGGESKSKGNKGKGKGKLRRMLPDCMQRPST